MRIFHTQENGHHIAALSPSVCVKCSLVGSKVEARSKPIGRARLFYIKLAEVALRPVINHQRIAISINDLAVAKPLLECRCGWGTQAELLLFQRDDFASRLFELQLVGNNNRVAVRLWVVLDEEAIGLFGGVLLAQVACLVAQANDHAFAVGLLRIKEASVVVIAIPDAVFRLSLLIKQGLGQSRLGGKGHRHVLPVVQAFTHGGPVVVVLAGLRLEEDLLAIDDLTEAGRAVGQVMVF